jgi:hypothetical protein
MLKTLAMVAPGSCMSPASPVTPIGCPLDFSPPDRFNGRRPSRAVTPSRITRWPSPCSASPIASYSNTSAMVKQSCVSTSDRSSSVTPARSSACVHADRAAHISGMSQRDRASGSLACVRARKAMARRMVIAVSASASTSTGAPSEISEQSLRLSSPATRGLPSDTVLQKATPRSLRIWAKGLRIPFSWFFAAI